MSEQGFGQTISDQATLRELYGEPSAVVQAKAVDRLDPTTIGFIARSPFVLVGTHAADGTADVSPRGGHPGFVKVLDEQRLLLPDLNGNRRIDTLRNIVDQPQVGLLFLVPGNGETVRVNGRAVVTVDEALLSSFDDEFRRPQSAIGVEVDEVFLHCAKSIRRSGLWNADEWDRTPISPGEILSAALAGTMDLDPALIDDGLEAGYAQDLEMDRPVSAEADR